MRRTFLALLVMMWGASACEPGDVDQLRAQLEAARGDVDQLRVQLETARAEAAAAQKDARRSERARQSSVEQLVQMRDQLAQMERQGEGLVMSIPRVGRLMWKCDNEREFSFTFTPEQATITVEQSIDGEITRRQLDPGEKLTSPFQPADVHREWTVTYRHKPATISAGISVVPEVSGGACFIRNSTLEQNRRPN